MRTGRSDGRCRPAPRGPALPSAALAECVRSLALEFASHDCEQRERVACLNERLIAVVPFWAAWPFEALVLQRAHAASLGELDDGVRAACAQILKEQTMRYDALFDVISPYTMGLHQRPTDGRDYPHWHPHAH